MTTMRIKRKTTTMKNIMMMMRLRRNKEKVVATTEVRIERSSVQISPLYLSCLLEPDFKSGFFFPVSSLYPQQQSIALKNSARSMLGRQTLLHQTYSNHATNQPISYISNITTVFGFQHRKTRSLLKEEFYGWAAGRRRGTEHGHNLSQAKVACREERTSASHRP